MAFDKNKLIDEAARLINKGALDKAIKLYLKIVDEDPKDVRIWLKLGDLYAKRQEKALATETYLKVAEFYAEQGFYLKAVAVYKQILRLDGRLVEVNLRLAELYRQLGLLQDAMQQYETVSQFYGREGRTRESLAALRQIVELDPENVSIRIKLAELYSREGLTQEAIEEFSRAADFLRSQSRTDDLLKVLERLSQHKTDDLDLLRDLARQYLEMADPPRALIKLQAAFRADPRDEETLSLLARAFEDLGQATKAVSVLRELAHLLDQSGDTAGRNSAFERLLALQPNDPEALVALGRRTTPIAVDAVPSPPTQPMSPPGPHLDEEERLAHALTEADVYVKYGLHDKAVEHLRRVFDWSPDNAEARLRLKEIYLEMGRAAEAVEELVQLGRTFLLSDTPRAATYLNEALDIDATHIEARALLTGLEGPAASHGPHREPARRSPPLTAPVPVDDVEPLEQGMAQLTPDELGLVVEPGEFDSLDTGRVDEEPALGADVGASEGVEVEIEASEDLEEDLGEDLGEDLEEALEVEVEEFGVEASEDLEVEVPPEPEAQDFEVEIPPEVEVEELEAVAEDDSAQVDDVEERAHHVDGDVLESPTGEPLDLSADEMDLFGRVSSRDDEEFETEEAEDAEAQESDVGEPEAAPGPRQDAAARSVGSGGSVDGAPRPDAVRPRAPEAAGDQDDIGDEIEEVDFFLQQSLYGEARDLLAEFMRRFGQHPALLERLAYIEKMVQRGLTPPPVAEPQGLGFEVQEPTPLPPQEEPPPQYSVEEVVHEVRRSAEVWSPQEDPEAHFQLGAAYHEMGLFEDSLREFDVAVRLGGKQPRYLLAIGRCLADRKHLPRAAERFHEALLLPGLGPSEAMALNYELAAVYEKMGEVQQARHHYEKVVMHEPNYRDVRSRIERLREEPEKADADDFDKAFEDIFSEDDEGSGKR